MQSPPSKKNALSHSIAGVIALLHFPVVHLHVMCEYYGLAALWALFGLAFSIEIYSAESSWSQRIVDTKFNFTKVVVALDVVGLLLWTYVWIWRMM